MGCPDEVRMFFLWVELVQRSGFISADGAECVVVKQCSEQAFTVAKISVRIGCISYCDVQCVSLCVSVPV